jgi:hypothetical protein
MRYTTGKHDMSNEKLTEALRSLRLKFTFGNDVPVPEARITRAEWGAIEQAHAAEKRRAREGVTDEMVELACRKYYNSGHKVYPPVFEAMRAALEAVWPDGQDAKDAARYRWALKNPDFAATLFFDADSFNVTAEIDKSRAKDSDHD